MGYVMALSAEIKSIEKTNIPVTGIKVRFHDSEFEIDLRVMGRLA
jgi:hypothetical protein